MSNGQCSAITNAMAAQRINNAQLASKAAISESRLSEILSGATKPSSQEFALIAGALNLSNPPAHAARVTA